MDVLFIAAGASGNGVMHSAREATGVSIIGVDTDQFDLGARGDGNIMLTSALKVMSVNVQRQLEAIHNGTFQGQNVILGAATDSTGFVRAPGRHQLSDATLAALEEVYVLVHDGVIVPAAQFNGHTPTNFPGL